MKTDKFLIGIVMGIVLLVIVAVVLVLARGQTETYVAEDTPEGVVHNYFLAIQREEFSQAYGYLADDLASKPDLDEFIRMVDSNSEASLKIGKTSIDNDRATVDISIITYVGGGPFDSGRNSRDESAYLHQNNQGQWKLTGYPYPYWGYNWTQEKE